eukprot:gene4873-5118_t
MRASRAVVRKLSRNRVLRIKLISLGDTGVGKSCLIKRYCEEKFISKYITTIGVDYGVKPVKFGDHEVRVNLWDLAGPAEYLEVRNEFYKDSQAALLVYDVSNRGSFEALSSWLEEARRHEAPASMVVVVAASKVDLPGRKVTEKEGRDWAAQHNFPYFEVSAASGRGLALTFHNLPEGLATYVGYLSSPKLGLSIALAIALHNIPEGFAVGIPIYYATGSKLKAIGWAAVSGLAEPVGALIGLALHSSGHLNPVAMGVVMAVVAGIMIGVSLRELIPQALSYDPDNKYVTNAVFAGMGIMGISVVLLALWDAAPL